MGLRERKKDKTRRRIVDAAFDLFRRYGFGPVTMDQVAEAAEVSRSTLFRYFGTKEALVFPYQAERLQRFSRLLARPVAGESAYETMERALVKMAEEFQDAADEIAAQQRIISDSPQLQARERALYDEWEQKIRQSFEAAAGGNRARRQKARLVAAALFGMVRQVIGEWHESGCRYDLAKRAKRMLPLLRSVVREIAPFLLDGGKR